MLDRIKADKLRRMMWTWGNTLFFINRKEREIRQFQDAIEDAYETLGARNTDGMPKGQGGRRSSVERAVEAAQHRIEQYGNALGFIQADIDKALALKQAIDEAVAELDPLTQRVLQLRYIDSHPWSFIGLKLHYDTSWVRACEKRALDVLSEKIEFLQNTSVL